MAARWGEQGAGPTCQPEGTLEGAVLVGSRCRWEEGATRSCWRCVIAGSAGPGYARELAGNWAGELGFAGRDGKRSWAGLLWVWVWF